MAGMTIAAQVDELKRNAPAEPDPRMAAFAREQAALAHAVPPATVAEVGAVLPDAELLDVEGESLRLSAALAGAPAVIVFYRGAWCPYCNITLRTYQAELSAPLRERGVGLIAVSPQKPDGSLTMQEKHDLDFAVLSDPGQALATALGIITAPTAESVQSQLELGMDLREVNADGTTNLPLPTVAIVAPDRTVRWLDVRVDYTARTEPEEILAALDAPAPDRDVP
jgi:peroxiredoxin